MAEQERRGHFRAYGPQKKFTAEKQKMVDHLSHLCEDYERRGYTVTVRQLHYQFVKENLYANTAQNYDRLQSALSDGRRAGQISWTAVEDVGRNLYGTETSSCPAESLTRLRGTYTLDKWRDQPVYLEVWAEKDGMLNALGKVCGRLEVNFTSCHGYNSDSELWRAGGRFRRAVQRGQRPMIFHLGDHDPSGVHMTVDNADKVEMFCGVRVQVVRLALNMPQIEELRLPPNPVKPTDSRTPGYVERFGMETCWELDALELEYIERLVRDAVLRVRDPRKWDEALARQAEDLETLTDAIALAGGEFEKKDEN